MDSLKPGHRFEHEIDAGKRFHADWALWKFADPARREMVWDSPWGPGFPGWRIECSAMSIHYLDRFVDVHVGGIDLRFPHHENERAQSDAATGQQVVRHWVHGEHLLFEGRKMAKSTGNVILLDDIVGVGHDPLALRLAFLEHRYRAQLNLTWATIGAADRTLTRWRTAVAGWAESPSRPVPAALRAEVAERFADDLDTAGALRLLRQVEEGHRDRTRREVRAVRRGRPRPRPGSGQGRRKRRCRDPPAGRSSRPARPADGGPRGQGLDQRRSATRRAGQARRDRRRHPAGPAGGWLADQQVVGWSAGSWVGRPYGWISTSQVILVAGT